MSPPSPPPSSPLPTAPTPSHFILPLFIHEESSSNQPIPSMPGIYRLAYGKNVVDHVAEARSLGVNQVVIFPKVTHGDHCHVSRGGRWVKPLRLQLAWMVLAQIVWAVSATSL